MILAGSPRIAVRIVALCVVAPSLGAQTPSAAEAGATACPVSSVSAAPRDTAARDTTARRPADTTRRAAGVAESRDRPTIIIYAEASAREVRFAAQPRIVVRLCGALTDSVRVVERRNLPERVQPGTTYRDVFIAVEIIGRLNAECLSQRITGERGATRSDDCASLEMRDTTRAAPARRPPS